MATIPQRLQNILPDKMHVYALDFFDHTDRTLLNEHVTQNKQERAHVDSFYPSAIEHRSHITLHLTGRSSINTPTSKNAGRLTKHRVSRSLDNFYYPGTIQSSLRCQLQATSSPRRSCYSGLERKYRPDSDITEGPVLILWYVTALEAFMLSY
jgi:hypothetical protein